MFECNYCIKSFFHSKTLEKRFENFNFVLLYNGAQNHEGFIGFENTCSWAKTYVILTSQNYVNFYACYCWGRQLLWQPWMRICKVQKLCINSMWIAWLIHGFLPVKTWLLIACNTAFYAIMGNSTESDQLASTFHKWVYYIRVIWVTEFCMGTNRPRPDWPYPQSDLHLCF